MKKPEVGDIVKFDDTSMGFTHGNVGKVLAVFDSLEVDWGEYGHEAMGLSEEVFSRDAEWFAVIESANVVFGIASFELIS